MNSRIRYGIISDIHERTDLVPLAIAKMKNMGINGLILNGDIINMQKNLKESQERFAFVLESVGRENLETYIQPGSHETILSYGPVLEYFSEKYKNILDVTKNQKIEKKNHHLIFLPGSDFLCDGEYQIGNHEQIPSGRYIRTKKGLMQFEEFEHYVGALQRGLAQGAMQYANMEDLRKLITAPEKTITVCHVPRKFYNLEHCVDVAEFGEAKQDFYLKDKKIEKGSVFPLAFAKQIFSKGYPVEIKRDNGGNENLMRIYGETGLSEEGLAFPSAHFHESSHRANDKYGHFVKEGESIRGLYWNSGALCLGKCGILTILDDKAHYENIVDINL